MSDETKPESVWWQDGTGKWRQGGHPSIPPLARTPPPPPRRFADRSGPLIALFAVLIFHGFGAFMWVAWLGFSSDIGTDSQLNRAIEIGAVTWLAATALIVWLWWSGKWPFSLLVPFAWWLPSFLLMVALVYSGDSVGYQSEVNAKATFAESASCLHYWRSTAGWTLNKDNVPDCFPTQTAAKRKALIACFNSYEREHPDHDGWPEENMRGCTWGGLVATPAPNVATLSLGDVLALPAAPRAGKRFVLNVPLWRSDSASKFDESEVDNPTLHVAVTIGGESLPIETVEGCSPCRLSGTHEAEYWFYMDQIRIRLTVPETADGKRMRVRITASQPDTPTVTKVVTFTVAL